MTKTEAVKFVTEAAWKRHQAVYTTTGEQVFSTRESCAALVYNQRSGTVAIGDERLCDCGAAKFNATLREALIEIGTPHKT